LNLFRVSDFGIRISNLIRMDLTSPKTIKELLAKHGAKPSKTMGQNFLVHRPTLDKIIEAANIKNTDTIIEVGPGLGTLTQELAKKAKKVIAIEKDGGMVEILKETLAGFSNVEVAQGNVLEISNFKFQISNYKVAANVPYYITSPIIRMFLEAKNQPEEIVLMIQKEVAQRICAKPGDMSILAASVQFYANAKIISKVSKECFWPKPNVDSAIIKITPKKEVPAVNPELFFKVVKAGFLHPRKQLINNLTKGLIIHREQVNSWLLENNINPLQRAETLSIQDWISLTASLDMIK